MNRRRNSAVVEWLRETARLLREGVKINRQGLRVVRLRNKETGVGPFMDPNTPPSLYLNMDRRGPRIGDFIDMSDEIKLHSPTLYGAVSKQRLRHFMGSRNMRKLAKQGQRVETRRVPLTDIRRMRVGKGATGEVAFKVHPSALPSIDTRALGKRNMAIHMLDLEREFKIPGHLNNNSFKKEAREKYKQKLSADPALDLARRNRFGRDADYSRYADWFAKGYRPPLPQARGIKTKGIYNPQSEREKSLQSLRSRLAFRRGVRTEHRFAPRSASVDIVQALCETASRLREMAANARRRCTA